MSGQETFARGSSPDPAHEAEQAVTPDSGAPGQGAPDSGVPGPEGSALEDTPEEAGLAGAGLAEDPLDAVARERDEYRDALVRLQADFENYKKRVRVQQAELTERAAESLVDKLLPVLDTADLALSHGGGEEVQHVSSALYSALDREGLERIDPVGEAFDPNLHEAVAHEPAGVDGGGQEVAEVLRAGYRWNGRVLRAAMVKVRG